jgi:hypothetical protein
VAPGGRLALQRANEGIGKPALPMIGWWRKRLELGRRRSRGGTFPPWIEWVVNRDGFPPSDAGREGLQLVEEGVRE